MAELVQLHLEKTIPELENMEQIGLCNRKEIKLIIKKRKNLEYKLRKSIKTKENYTRYIEYELDLLHLIWKRRKRLMCEVKKEEIDHPIANRINKLFKTAVRNFPGDELLRLNQIAFCRRMKWNNLVSALYANLLQVHSWKEGLWVEAAKWEFEQNHSPDTARDLFLKALRFNPHSPLLYREYFRMELMYCDLMRKRQKNLGILAETGNDGVLDGMLALRVFDTSLKHIDDVEFALSFIEICQEFDFARKHMDYVFNSISEHYGHAEETQDALAKRPILCIEDTIQKGMQEGKTKKEVIHAVYDEVCRHYEKSILEQCTSKMWNFYLDFVTHHLESVKNQDRKRKLQEKLLALLERALAADCLSQEHHSQWIDILDERGEKEAAFSVCLAAARRWNSDALWERCLSLQDSEELFREALSNVQDSFRLWQMAVAWFSFHQPEQLNSLFEEGLKCGQPLEQMYLEWVGLRQGIQAARRLYARLTPSPQLFRAIIRMEKAEVNPSIQNLRKYHEDALSELGSKYADIWISYIAMEVDHPKGNPEACATLYWRAKKTLDDDSMKEFIMKTTLHSVGQRMTE